MSMKCNGKMESGFKYFAFISYQRGDERWAKWLQHKLEGYHLPSVIRKNYPDFPKRIDTFRDKDNIGSGPLRKILLEGLSASRYLIVICSPRSAQSDWVGEEIQSFIRMGRQEQIILFIVDGTPYSGNHKTECFHPIVRDYLPEILGININEQGTESRYIKREKAFIRVITRILEIDFDVLWNRYKRRKIRNVIVWICFSLFILIAFGVIWRINQPFDMVMKLNEITPYNSKLPFEKGEIKLILLEDTLLKSVNDSSASILFKNIPGKFYNEKVNVLFDMRGYAKVDTCLVLKEALIVNIARDMTWGLLGGIVTDDHLLPIAGVKVAIRDGLCVTTDENGKFMICIPIEQQLQYVDVSFMKQGYVRKEFCHALVSEKWQVVLTEEKQ